MGWAELDFCFRIGSNALILVRVFSENSLDFLP